GRQNSVQGWRAELPGGGILMDVQENKILIEGLYMPHSPRMYNGDLYLLQSALGQLIKVDPIKGDYEIIKELNGFARGMAKIDDYIFIAMSKLRKNSSNFRHLEIAEKATESGVKVIHLPSRSLVAELNYKSSVDEIYDLQILPEICRPGILNTHSPMYKQALSIPGATFWAQESKSEK
ncbi:MAG: DUF4915 domain-containing protein, partial [Saprospiraceae bacterium]|nr:DUF4915 domain-containing protein [Saprospiraceae bacterium]